jgi:murein DD-endopeptidase MepM/ murein hydrolase activator NlpD
MASRRWTVVFVPEDGAKVRQFQLSRERARLLGGIALIAVAAASSLATVALVGDRMVPTDERLHATNEVLRRELNDMTERLVMLEGSLERLAGKDEHYRLIAGLEPLGSDVLMAGIGGPDGDSLEASHLYRLDEHAGVRVFSASMQLNSLLRRASVLSSSWREAESALSGSHARLAATPSIAPTKGRVSSSFTHSRLHPILDRARPHLGLDIVAAVGTPVVAPANGRVTYAARRGHYGLLIEIDHGHGTVTRYAHLSRTSVRPGQVVQRGDTMGAVGTSGLSVGPHLHYEVLVNGRHVNPTRYILDTDVLPD